VDFGLAKMKDPGPGRWHRGGRAPTSPAPVVHRLRHASPTTWLPSRAAANRIDHRSDLYACGGPFPAPLTGWPPSRPRR
jgi:hypothetical protein